MRLDLHTERKKRKGVESRWSWAFAPKWWCLISKVTICELVWLLSQILNSSYKFERDCPVVLQIQNPICQIVPLGTSEQPHICGTQRHSLSLLSAPVLTSHWAVYGRNLPGISAPPSPSTPTSNPGSTGAIWSTSTAPRPACSLAATIHTWAPRSLCWTTKSRMPPISNPSLHPLLVPFS